MPSVVDTVELLQRLESKDIKVHPHRCVIVRNRNVACGRCADACTSGAITVDNAHNDLSIDSSLCVGCGTCATVCPTCALEAKHPSDAELVERSLAALEANDGEAVIACEQIMKAAHGLVDPAKAVSVPCLGRVEESLLTLLVLRGARKVRLVRAKCAECPRKVGELTAEKVVETENIILETWDSDVRVKLSDKLPKSVRMERREAYDSEKRGFFRNMKAEAKTAAVTTADFALESELGMERPQEPKLVRVNDEGVLPTFVPERRERLLDVLCNMGEPEDEMIDTRLWGHVIIDTEKCMGCQMCAVFCPTGAIRKFKDEDGTMGVTHFPGDCVKCHTCETVCLRDCLTLSEAIFARDLVEGRCERYEMPDPNLHFGMLNNMRSNLGTKNVSNA